LTSRHALARTRLAAKYFFGRRLEARVVSRIRRSRRSSFASPASNASRAVAGHVLHVHGRAPGQSDLERAANGLAALGPILVRERDPHAGRLGRKRVEHIRQLGGHARTKRAGGPASTKLDPGSDHALSSVRQPDLTGEHPPPLAE